MVINPSTVLCCCYLFSYLWYCEEAGVFLGITYILCVWSIAMLLLWPLFYPGNVSASFIENVKLWPVPYLHYLYFPAWLTAYKIFTALCRMKVTIVSFSFMKTSIHVFFIFYSSFLCLLNSSFHSSFAALLASDYIPCWLAGLTTMCCNAASAALADWLCYCVFDHHHHQMLSFFCYYKHKWLWRPLTSIIWSIVKKHQ